MCLHRQRKTFSVTLSLKPVHVDGPFTHTLDLDPSMNFIHQQMLAALWLAEPQILLSFFQSDWLSPERGHGTSSSHSWVFDKCSACLHKVMMNSVKKQRIRHEFSTTMRLQDGSSSAPIKELVNQTPLPTAPYSSYWGVFGWSPLSVFTVTITPDYLSRLLDCSGRNSNRTRHLFCRNGGTNVRPA